MKRYIGTKPYTVSSTGWKSGGNEGEVFTQNEHGNYQSDNKFKRDMVLSQEDIDHDVAQGFLKEIEEL